MGCHTWVYKKTKHFDNVSNDTMKRRCIRICNYHIKLYSNIDLAFFQKEYNDPEGKMWNQEWVDERVAYWKRLKEIIKKYNFKRMTLINFYSKHHIKSGLLYKVYNGTVYESCNESDKKFKYKYHDFFRYYTDDPTVIINNLDDCWELFINPDSRCWFWGPSDKDDENSQWIGYKPSSAPDWILERMRKKFEKIFKDNDIIIEFG